MMTTVTMTTKSMTLTTMTVTMTMTMTTTLTMTTRDLVTLPLDDCRPTRTTYSGTASYVVDATKSPLPAVNRVLSYQYD